MPQDQESGSRASRWGHANAKRIAAAIGASIPSGRSNECLFTGQRVVIKSAAPRTGSVGVTYRMLGRIDLVIGAFQVDGRTFDVRSLPVADFRAATRPTRSRGASAGKVGIVERDTFFNKGRPIQRVQL